MVKAQKLLKGGTAFITDEDIHKAIESCGTAMIKITSEAQLEHSEKYGNDRYVAECELFFDKKMTKSEPRKWTMNATSSDYLIEKLGDDTADWKGKLVELETVRTATPEGMRNVIYPVGAADKK